MIHCQPQAIDSPHRLCIVHTIHMRYVFFIFLFVLATAWAWYGNFSHGSSFSDWAFPISCYPLHLSSPRVQVLQSISSRLTQSAVPSYCICYMYDNYYALLFIFFFFYERKKGRTNSLCHERLTNTPPHFNFPVFAVLRIYRHSHPSYIYIIDRHVLLN